MNNETKGRTIRIPEDLWRATQDQAHEDETTVTRVILDALERYVEQGSSTKAVRMSPGMHGAADKINDPIRLFARVGYRIYRSLRDPARDDFYTSWNNSDLNRAAELRGERLYPRNAVALVRDAKGAGWSVETEETEDEHRVTCTSPDGGQVITSVHTNGKFTEAKVTFPEQDGRTVLFRNISAARKYITSAPEDREIKE